MQTNNDTFVAICFSDSQSGHELMLLSDDEVLLVQTHGLKIREVFDHRNIDMLMVHTLDREPGAEVDRHWLD